MNTEKTDKSEIFALALQNHQKNNLKVAEKLYNEILNITPNHFESLFYLGSLHLQTGNLKRSKELLEEAIKIKPNFAHAYNNLAKVYKDLGESKKAFMYFKKAIEIDPKISPAHNNLGNLHKELGNLNEALTCYKKAIFLNPKFSVALNNLGIVLHSLKKYDEAIKYFNEATKSSPNFSAAHYNLGKILKELGRYDEAIKSLKKANTTRSRAELLESVYFSKGVETYLEILKKLKDEDPLNLRVATMSAYVSQKESINNIYPFCKNPLEYIFTKNLKNDIKNIEKFSTNLSKILSKSDFIWEPTTKSTSGGFHTSGNLFNKKENDIYVLRELILQQVIYYQNHYKLSKDLFITRWPKIYDIEAWHVKLLKNGYQKSHIHPAGWLSGCFYIKIPKKLKNEEGGIKFSLIGYDYIFDNKLPNLTFVPKEFDIALFPSSLFHETIPFKTEEERHVVAFDIMPKK